MESVSLFDWIAGLSPWWWVAFGIGLGALEMATGSFFLIWPALAAIAMAINIAIGPSFSGEVIVILYAGLSIVLTFLGRQGLSQQIVFALWLCFGQIFEKLW